jgi:hypothetical protein
MVLQCVVRKGQKTKYSHDAVSTHSVPLFQLFTDYRSPKRNLKINSLPLLFKSLLPGQEDCVFFSGH